MQQKVFYSLPHAIGMVYMTTFLSLTLLNNRTSVIYHRCAFIANTRNNFFICPRQLGHEITLSKAQQIIPTVVPIGWLCDHIGHTAAMEGTTNRMALITL